jgi:hypothetical protein
MFLYPAFDQVEMHLLGGLGQCLLQGLLTLSCHHPRGQRKALVIESPECGRTLFWCRYARHTADIVAPLGDR